MLSQEMVGIISTHKNKMSPPLRPSLSPPKGGTDTVFGCFLSLGGPFRADSFCNDLGISSLRFRHPTKGIPAEKMFDPPQRGGQTLFLCVF